MTKHGGCHAAVGVLIRKRLSSVATTSPTLSGAWVQSVWIEIPSSRIWDYESCKNQDWHTSPYTFWSREHTHSLAQAMSSGAMDV
jgi:hypothetical protein